MREFAWVPHALLLREETSRGDRRAAQPGNARVRVIFSYCILLRGVPWVLLREQLGRSDDGLRGFGAGPPTAGGEPSGYQALKPPQINIDLTKSLKYESFRSPKIELFLADNRAKFTSRS